MANALRREGMFVEFDVVGRSVKAQMKYANKIGARFTVVIGDSELENGTVKLKNMETGEEQELQLASFESDILNISISESLKEFDNLDFSGIMNI